MFSPPEKGAEVKLPPEKKPVKSPEPEPISVKPIKTLGPLAYGISPLAFSPDDTTLAAGGWSGPTNTSPWTPADPSEPAFLAVGQWSGEVKLWDVPDGKAIAAQKILGRPQSLAFGPDAKTLVIASDGAVGRDMIKYHALAIFLTGETVVWDFAGNKVVKTIKDDAMGLWPRLSPDGKLLAFLSLKAAPLAGINLWNVGAGKRIEVLEGIIGPPTFSPDGKMLASERLDGKKLAVNEMGSRPTTLQVWRLDEGRCTLTLHEQRQRNEYGMFAFSQDNKTLAAGFLGKENMIKLFDVASGKNIVTIDVLAGMPTNVPIINSLAFSPDGKLLAVGLNTE